MNLKVAVDGQWLLQKQFPRIFEMRQISEVVHTRKYVSKFMHYKNSLKNENRVNSQTTHTFGPLNAANLKTHFLACTTCRIHRISKLWVNCFWGMSNAIFEVKVKLRAPSIYGTVNRWGFHSVRDTYEWQKILQRLIEPPAPSER